LVASDTDLTRNPLLICVWQGIKGLLHLDSVIIGHDVTEFRISVSSHMLYV